MSIPPETVQWMAEVQLDTLRAKIRDRLMDCSTVDFYDISAGGVDNLALLAAQVAQEFIKDACGSRDRMIARARREGFIVPVQIVGSA